MQIQVKLNWVKSEYSSELRNGYTIHNITEYPGSAELIKY